MKPKDQLIAMATACGWDFIRFDEETQELIGVVGLRTCPIPNFLKDLNAMHDAEKTLVGQQRDNYGRKLALIKLASDDTSHFTACHATAAQKVEVFLKVIGKWEDSKDEAEPRTREEKTAPPNGLKGVRAIHC